MAKKSWIQRNKKKERAVAKYAKKRAELKAKGDYIGLSMLPRNASPTRVVNRCEVTGRRHGFFADSKCLELPSESSRPEEIYLELLSQVGRYFYLAEVHKFS